MHEEDTIIALATPNGQSAIAVVRLSGGLCLEVVADVFKRRTPPAYRMSVLGNYHCVDGRELDQVLFTLFAHGASFTGETVLEIACHGNPLIVRLIIQDCVQRGCRLAEPGEFTRRAFMSGQMDLSQAEAVAEMISAQSERALSAARKRLHGAVGKCIDGFCSQLLEVLAQLEAYIDFPEEDLPDETEVGPIKGIAELITNMRGLAETGRYAELLNNGIKTIIVGPPNAGKSSLLNALVGEDRALVSSEPGTTRDFITERIMLGHHCITIMDTAGLRDGETALERAGVTKTLEKMQQAEFFLYVIDSTLPSPVLPPGSLELFHVEQTLVVENKCDLAESFAHPDVLPGRPHVRVSSQTGEGLEVLKALWAERLEKDLQLPSEDVLVVGARHAGALVRAAEALELALEGYQRRTYTELVCVHLREALDALGEITGRINNEQLLDTLFAKFCIGK